jgi:hypothetical protein
VDSRTATAIVGIGISFAITVLAWWYFESVVVFLVLPFVPILFRRLGSEPERLPEWACPRCGFRTRNPEYGYCPRDGTALERQGRHGGKE